MLRMTKSEEKRLCENLEQALLVVVDLASPSELANIRQDRGVYVDKTMCYFEKEDKVQQFVLIANR